MVEIGDSAPEFVAPLAGDFPFDEFDLSQEIGDHPIVFAFFPAAFTRGCTREMCAFRDEFGAFEALDADVYGISVDSPAALQEFKEKHDIDFEMISDFNRGIIDKYDVVREEVGGLKNLARRSVFVLDDGGVVTYRWESSEPGELPSIEEVKRQARAVSE